MTRENRLRRFAEDLIAILDARDDLALEQAKALSVVPAGLSKPTRQAGFVESVARGIVKMPLLELGAAANREATLERRTLMRARREDSFLSFEDVGEVAAFEREESQRYAIASELIRRGVADGDVIVRAGLFGPDELEEIKSQIGL